MTRKEKAEPSPEQEGSERDAAIDEPVPSGDPEERASEERAPFFIVGIGASAGGLEAFNELLQALPADTGMGFVIIQHMDPTHTSMLSTILARKTAMPVELVEDNMRVERNKVYVIPPGTNLVVHEGVLKLAPRTEDRGKHRPIDLFLRSLAEEHGHEAIGVILSGTASDGTLGLEEIKAAGGITFAQDGTAEQGSMPRSAIAAGCVDFVLPPDEIAREIARISRHPLVASGAGRVARSEPAFNRILDTLRHGTGVDFTQYKRNTLHRRITRRVVLHKLDGLKSYLRHLESDPDEVSALYQDILINVTSFFRNPESYEALKTVVFPRLVEDRDRNEPVRVWTIGCSTGEEAYSIAMAYTEFAEQEEKRVGMQVFATDLNGAGIERARAGVYPKGIVVDVSPERLRRFFVEADGAYRVCKPIRDMCVFARQNVLTDAPFSRIDLVSCRNVLIYLEPVLQQKLIPILHYSLRNSGYLWLGTSETIGTFRDLFALENPRHKLYARRPARRPIHVPMTRAADQRPRPPPQLAHEPAVASAMDLQREADRILLARYAPPGVVVNHDLEIIQFRGDTSPYLAPAQGRASLNLLKMLREGLLVAVRGAVHRARREDVTVREEGLRVTSNGGMREVNIVAAPVKGSGTPADTVLVLFEEPAHGAEARARQLEADARNRAEAAALKQDPESSDKEVIRLKQELNATREYLQSVIEQQESANEELQSANEEVQSGNEELQSINEELETSKEEIQSSNEELATVNEELQNRNLELSLSNNDLTNLLASVQMAIVMLDPDLRIRRFTPAAEKLLNLIPSDVGRPLTDIQLGLTVQDLDRLMVDAIDTASTREREVQDGAGRWFSLRIRPYRTLENRIEGAVLMLVDIDALKRSENSLRESEARFQVLADSAPVMIWVNGLEGCQFVNRAYEEFVGVEEARLRRFDWTSFVHPEDRAQYMSAYVEAVGARRVFEAQARFRRSDGEYRWMKSVGKPRFLDGGELVGYVGSTFDISDMKHAESSLREMDRRKDEFLATLAHELRNPLASIKNAAYLLRSDDDPSATSRARDVIERQTTNMVRLVDDLLDVARITHDKVQLKLMPVELNALIRQMVAASEHERSTCAHKLVLRLPEAPVWVRGDATRLEQVFANLLSNASKFTQEGGNIWLTAELEAGGSTIAVSVRDDGIGIEESMLTRIFDLFVQGNRSSHGSLVGVGLGLSLAKRLVELHGGTIEARSAGLSHGSEFVVRLPVLSQEEVPPSTAADGASRAGESRPAAAKPRVMVVDDNPDSGETLSALLAMRECVVCSARSGSEALRLAREFGPDVVLLDIGLPDIDGYQVARRLRQQHSGAKIIAVTGYGRDEDVRRGREAGIDQHLTKPVELEKLLSMIEPDGGPAR